MPFTRQQATEFVLQQFASLTFWTFVVALASTVLALLALIFTVRYGRRQIGLAEEQLTLARKEAENRPVLEVSAMDLIDPVEIDAVVECAQERKEWLDEWEQYERAKQDYEQRRADAPTIGGMSLGLDPYPKPPDFMRPFNNYLLLAQQDYDGPFPDWVLRVTVVNKGKTAALDVSGQLYLNPDHLEPLDFPGLDGNVEAQEDGTHQVSVYTGEGSRLLPAPTDEELTFDVAVLVKQPTTNIRYAFATPQGDHVEDRWSLEIPTQ